MRPLYSYIGVGKVDSIAASGGGRLIPTLLEYKLVSLDQGYSTMFSNGPLTKVENLRRYHVTHITAIQM